MLAREKGRPAMKSVLGFNQSEVYCSLDDLVNFPYTSAHKNSVEQ